MIKTQHTIFVATIVFLFGCDFRQGKRAQAKIEPKSESLITGQAFFSEKSGKVKVEISVTGVEPGPTAVHLHSIGDCSSEDAMSSGGHWNPTKDKHGKWGEGQFHSGDIGNINIDESGKGVLILIDQHNRWSIGGPAETNVIGRAVVVHQGKDDMVSQPSGAAGKRTGCGPIIETTGVTEK